MTTDTPLLRIFKKLITESEEDKAANEINDLPLLERLKKMITEYDNEIDDYPFEKHKLAIENFDAAKEFTFEEYYERSDIDVDYYGESVLNQAYGLCPKCNQPNTDRNWCKVCNSKRFQQNFGNWTNGNEHIDNFIQDSQLEPRNRYELLEWISYTKLRNIKKITVGGFGIVYKGVWLDGLISHWDYEKQDWKRVTHELNE
ncbi:unnamed protein product [Rhizophagus irregularis]|nr:unnamed protein product [Rhizophagus irregularis]